MHRNEPESRFQIGFSHERTGTEGCQYADRVVDSDVLKGVGVFRNKVVDAIALGIRQMIDSAPIGGMLFRDHPDGVALEISEGWGEERPSDATKPNLLI